MRAPTPDHATLFRLWRPDGEGPPALRLDQLARALDPTAGADAPGARNRRLLALRAGLDPSTPEAQVACPQCGAENAFEPPFAAMLSAPPPDHDATVKIGAASYRLPEWDDLIAVGADPAALAQRCRVAGPADAPFDGLADAWAALDPAGAATVDLTCADCGAAVTATLDPADFVAAELDRLVNGLFRQIDAIARAYGWSET
ncbi:MAG: hypothetical protein ACK4WC_17395, partial [Rubrimonas sp.]